MDGADAADAAGAPGGGAGSQWLVEAFGCDPARLRDPAALGALFGRLIEDLSLHPVAPPAWHRFPGPGGVTGFVMLSESHLACHTFPEHRSLCLDLFCCGERPRWDFAAGLRAAVGARRVRVRRVRRPYRVPARVPG